TPLASTRNVRQLAVAQVHAPDAMPFAQGDPQLTVPDEQGPRAEHRFAFSRLAGDRQFLLAIAGDGRHDARLGIDPADAVVGDVRHINVVVLVEGDTVRIAELGLRGQPAVAAETLLAGTGHGADDTGL